MSLFPKSPLLEALARRIPARSLRNFTIVAVQHLLETTGSLFECLLEFEIRPSDVFVVGKPYSTNREVVQSLRQLGISAYAGRCAATWGGGTEQLAGDVSAMWAKVSRALENGNPQGIIVLDDGGLCAAGVPKNLLGKVPVIGVEQTMAGAREPHPLIPVVEVASSAVKTLLEPPMICEAVLKRLNHLGLFARSRGRFGVVGLGNIGRTIALELVARGNTVYTHDSNYFRSITNSFPRAVSGATHCSRLEELFVQSDVVFGCTGRDILEGQTWWTALCGDKTLVSCSSHDEEFRTALLSLNALPAPPPDRLANVLLPLERGRLGIVRGGCPVNFDGSRESVPLEDIQLTRALLFTGVLQAARLCDTLWRCEYARLMLSPAAQFAAARDWFALRGDTHRYPAETLKIFSSIGTIAAHSGGTPADSLKAETASISRA